MKEGKFLKEIVIKAAALVEESFVVENKGAENDLVTSLDFKIEHFLIDEINREYPDFAIVSEEFNTNNKITENCFIVDPIDGTINFANHSPLWGIQVACVKEGKTIASVIYLPQMKELYYADLTGAYLNNEKISVHEVPIKNTLYAIDGNNNLPSMQRMRKYSSNRRNYGAVCVSMAFVASGRIHGAVFRSDKPWDYEPGVFLAKMAGASVESKSGFHGAAMNQEFLHILEEETAKKMDKKNIFLLHSLNGDTLKTWGLNVKEVFGAKEIDVYLPEFPIRAESTYEKFKNVLLFYLENGTLNENSVVIAHSIGNAYFLRFCLEENFVPYSYIAVAPGAVYDIPTMRTDYIVEVKKQAYLKPDAFLYAREKLKNVYCFYSLEDDQNLEKFTRFIKDTNAEGIFLEGYNHFDFYHRIYKIPELIELVDKLI